MHHAPTACLSSDSEIDTLLSTDDVSTAVRYVTDARRRALAAATHPLLLLEVVRDTGGPRAASSGAPGAAVTVRAWLQNDRRGSAVAVACSLPDDQEALRGVLDAVMGAASSRHANSRGAARALVQHSDALQRAVAARAKAALFAGDELVFRACDVAYPGITSRTWNHHATSAPVDAVLRVAPVVVGQAATNHSLLDQLATSACTRGQRLRLQNLRARACV